MFRAVPNAQRLISNTVRAVTPTFARGSEQTARAAEDKAGVRVVTVTALAAEIMQDGFSPTRGDFKARSEVGSASRPEHYIMAVTIGRHPHEHT